jgi:hypothetical protein
MRSRTSEKIEKVLRHTGSGSLTSREHTVSVTDAFPKPARPTMSPACAENSKNRILLGKVRVLNRREEGSWRHDTFFELDLLKTSTSKNFQHAAYGIRNTHSTFLSDRSFCVCSAVLCCQFTSTSTSL